MRRIAVQMHLSILKACMKTRRPTDLHYEMRANYTTLQKYTEKLIDLGYLEKVPPEDPKDKRTNCRLKTTFKGAQLLIQYRDLMRALEELK